VSAPASTVDLTEITRNGVIESVHRGAVVVTRGSTIVEAWGDPHQLVFARSTTKPFQALPFVENGGLERYSVLPVELALMMASHGGTPEHVAGVLGLMKKLGVKPDDLQCGTHAPFDVPSSHALIRAGERPSVLHNNCSGKHTGFVALARDMGGEITRYLDPTSISQRAVYEAVRSMTETRDDELFVGSDGCCAPTFRMPLVALARGFGKLARPVGCTPQRTRALEAMLAAVTAHPTSFSSPGRLEEALLQTYPGRVFPKNGAEGVCAIGLPGIGVGIAIKVTDGHERGYIPTAMAVLKHLGLFTATPPALTRFERPNILDANRRVVGHAVSTLFPSGASTS
ncbi:MAG: asparaginase, partial [Clostridia bacterium]|nr:asparaginase [Deltaproteobacteria bacterium]